MANYHVRNGRIQNSLLSSLLCSAIDGFKLFYVVHQTMNPSMALHKREENNEFCIRPLLTLLCWVQSKFLNFKFEIPFVWQNMNILSRSMGHICNCKKIFRTLRHSSFHKHNVQQYVCTFRISYSFSTNIASSWYLMMRYNNEKIVW